MLERSGVQGGAQYRCDAFGGCPECGQNSGYTHTGRKRWYYCHIHETRWCGGEVLSCYWKIEATEEFAQNEARVNSYREVEPLSPVYPVVLKNELEMTDEELTQHLRALAQRMEHEAELRFRRIMSTGSAPAVVGAS